MALNLSYLQRYTISRAIVVGINSYQFAPKLKNAKQDAEAIAKTLQSDCDFLSDNVIVLTDQQATKSNIMEAFRSFLQDGTLPDDRIVFYFAGHGHTATGNRGEVGYLVPVDGQSGKPNSLIRWDELTRDVDLIHAKHIFFIVDACFGGLAVTRAFQTGSSRFLKDMLQRLSRQVLAAGKEDESVSDGGGPIAGHSVFTGHLLNGISGGAAASNGVITANSLISYVYDMVANDQHSRQTPHSGHIDGDGDVIIKSGELGRIEADVKIAHDILVDFSSFAAPIEPAPRPLSVVANVTELLSEPKRAIALDGFVTNEIRSASGRIAGELNVNSGEPLDFESLLKRLQAYEGEMTNLGRVDKGDSQISF